MKQRTHLKMHRRNQFLVGCVSVDAVLTPQLRDPSTLALAVPGCTKAHNHTTTTVRKKPARNVHWQHPVTPILDHASNLLLIFPKMKNILCSLQIWGWCRHMVHRADLVAGGV